MSPLVITVLGLLSLTALGVALLPGLVGGSRASKRIKALSADGHSDSRVKRNDVSRSRESLRKSLQATIDAQGQTAASKRVPLKKKLMRAGMTISDSAFRRNCVILAAIIFLLAWVTGVPVYFALVFGMAGGYVIPMWQVGRRTKKYHAEFLEEFPNAVESIVRGVQAGMPLNDSMRLVAKEAKEPVATEFVKIIEQLSVGKNIAQAVPIIYDRLPISEVNFFVVVITVQQQAGGNLSEALGNLATVLRNRKKMKAKVKAMSSEAKASAGIIGALPFVVTTLVSLVSPSYMLPLFQTYTGNIWLGVAVVMMSLGVLVMRKMIKFDF